eukprot:TRINITY_DN23732_c0_g1_i4.p1 TRINITY_DN23732_c0_g1~~TRINITY_DN23732_c0_g1_i4.p1  ORF type:complete len:179 (-),score=20.68 TRINITY_DN23732_c0_g1_i4:69-527(-)
MLENKQFSDMFKQFLPMEFQQDDAILEMMQNPKIKQQIEEQIAGQIKSPEMMNNLMEQMHEFDIDKSEAELQKLGTSHKQLMSKMMSDKDMQTLILKPNVQKALLAIKHEPSKLYELIGDTDVEQVVLKFKEILPAQNQDTLSQNSIETSIY